VDARRGRGAGAGDDAIRFFHHACMFAEHEDTGSMYVRDKSLPCTVRSTGIRGFSVRLFVVRLYCCCPSGSSSGLAGFGGYY